MFMRLAIYEAIYQFQWQVLKYLTTIAAGLEIVGVSTRDTKSQNFPVGRFWRAKTFRTECVNSFCDISAPTVRKSLSRHICAKSFQTVQKLSRRSGKFPDSPEIFQTVRESCMLQKRFTHFWRIYVAKTIYALRPESFCAWNSADRKVLTFCVSAVRVRPRNSDGL